jgi:hypothetical protein
LNILSSQAALVVAVEIQALVEMVAVAVRVVIELHQVYLFLLVHP